MPGVGIVGCGVVGRKRADALGPARLVACADTLRERADALAAGRSGVAVDRDWESLVVRPDVDIVIVATTNDALASITRAAVEAGTHVLVEKPAARSAAELEPVASAAARTRSLVRVGFNHRYHPALLKAGELVAAGAIGPLMFVRGRYGHGGRPGYEREWRADPVRSGGGELLDQGVHLIDLARRFLGDFSDVQGFAATFYWPMPVEDNAFLLLRTDRQQAAMLHVSWTEWKNLFSFELFGRTGKIQIDGLGGSYGTERATLYEMGPEMGPPATTGWEFPGPDRSWAAEFAEFLDDIRLGRPPAAGLPDALAALRVVEAVYRSPALRASAVGAAASPAQ
ncbi:MAG: Gfo/Idh/MocA family oxidoreductase [Acidobacteria bacterium]|nr:Gfo/Idh/MocA family oxidoreductase [Acidobacteriota bacterium]